MIGFTWSDGTAFQHGDVDIPINIQSDHGCIMLELDKRVTSTHFGSKNCGDNERFVCEFPCI